MGGNLCLCGLWASSSCSCTAPVPVVAAPTVAAVVGPLSVPAAPLLTLVLLTRRSSLACGCLAVVVVLGCQLRYHATTSITTSASAVVLL